MNAIELMKGLWNSHGGKVEVCVLNKTGAVLTRGNIENIILKGEPNKREGLILMCREADQ